MTGVRNCLASFIHARLVSFTILRFSVLDRRLLESGYDPSTTNILVHFLINGLTLLYEINLD